MKSLLTTVCVLIAISLMAGNTKEAQSSFGKNFLPIWEVSTNNALDVAKAMPEDLYDYKPNDSSRTFAEQMVHIATSSKGIAEGFITGQRSGGESPKASELSKTQIIELMEKNFALVADMIAEMTDAQANETIKVFGGKEVVRYIAVMFIQDHLANHRAKANLYIRMNDIRPPRYGFF